MRAKINGVWTVESSRQLVAGFSYTTPENCTAIAFNGCANPSDRVCMVNKGQTALPYEPYGKVWYLNKQIGKVVLDGSENWVLNSSSGDSYRYWLNNTNFENTFPNIIEGYEIEMDGKTLVNYFKYKAFSQTAIGTYTLNNKSGVKWFLINSSETSVANFQTWLSTHNTTVYYVLATPTYEEITGELLSQLEALAYSYEGTTNISQDNDDLPFVLDITALKEMS